GRGWSAVIDLPEQLGHIFRDRLGEIVIAAQSTADRGADSALIKGRSDVATLRLHVFCFILGVTFGSHWRSPRPRPETATQSNHNRSVRGTPRRHCSSACTIVLTPIGSGACAYSFSHVTSHRHRDA